MPARSTRPPIAATATTAVIAIVTIVTVVAVTSVVAVAAILAVTPLAAFLAVATVAAVLTIAPITTVTPLLTLGLVARAALRLTAWTERWIPDAFIFALLATILVVLAALTWTSSTAGQIVDAWGNGFWDLIPFTLQMALIIITGHVLATSAPMVRAIRAIASWPTTPKGAVVLVTAFALVTSWFNWGFSLVFSAVLGREVARRVRQVDYRALGAASVLGLGSIWAQGLSGSAALQMATPGALQPQIRDIVAAGGLVPGGLIPFRHTIFLWQSLLSVVIEIAVVCAVLRMVYVDQPFWPTDVFVAMAASVLSAPWAWTMASCAAMASNRLGAVTRPRPVA